MSALGEQFVSEARELVAQATDALLGIERDGVSAGLVDQVLRAFHTLKGSAGLLDLPAMVLAMHVAEDLATSIQGGGTSPTPPVITQMLACLDLVAGWIDAFESGGDLPPSAGNEAREMSEALRGVLAPSGPAAAPQGGVLPGWAVQTIQMHHATLRSRAGVGELFAIAYEPRASCFYDGDDPLQLLRRIPALLALRVEGANIPPAEIDPFACLLRFYVLAEGPRDALAGIFRLVPDQVQIVDLPADALHAVPEEVAPAGAHTIVRRLINEQREMLQVSGPDNALPGRIGAAGRSAANALRHARLDQLADEVNEAGAAAQVDADAGALVAALAVALSSIDAQTSSAPVATAGNPDATEDAANRWIRVPEARVDALINLSGELIVLKNSFAHLARRIESEGSQDLSRAMRREQEAIDRLAGEVHDAVLRLRMVPLAQAFRPMPRLVRDLSQQLGKKVQLVTRGETVESDKAVVDRLFEPLLHIVRNAVDHGIETPQVRKAAGKPEAGTIAIAASRAGDRIIIQIEDDGRGIDPEAVRRTAEQRRLMAPDALAVLSDEETIELIFAAGFSTAAEITDISGRGVGMDVVRKTVEQIGGRVFLTSRKGGGTTVRLDMPVSIATARIMVVESAGQRFGISMDSVSETVRLTPNRVSQVKQNEGFVLRDRVVPICSLAELMSLGGQTKTDAESRLLIVLEVGTKIAAVEVDAIRARTEAVLKPMQGLLAGARGYAGTTILGDGTVLLVLDLKEILG